jgi:glycosyltransferase involved in cell wall biosynthesis
MATGLDRSRWRPVCLLPFEGPLADDLRAADVEVEIVALPVLRRADPREHVREFYPRWPLLWPAYRRRLERARAVVCVSHAVAQQFGPRARVIHDGLAVIPERAPDGRTALGLPADGTMVAVLGRLSEWKGQDRLIRALPLTRDARALIAGDAWPGQERHEQSLRDLARELGVADRVHFIGFRDDLENVLGAADIVAVPSTRPDPFPNSALEAAAAGCCVIAINSGGLPEMLRHDETGYLYDGSPEALAVAIDTADRDRLGAAARADVRERFAPERMLDGIHRLYAEISP